MTVLRYDAAPARCGHYAERALAEAAAGRLRPLIGQTFPARTRRGAHAAMEARATVGKTLLVIGS